MLSWSVLGSWTEEMAFRYGGGVSCEYMDLAVEDNQQQVVFQLWGSVRG